MQLNLPIAEELAECENLLIAGMGGGFDLYCGLPIYLELKRMGRRVHLANLSFSQATFLKNGERIGDSIVGVSGKNRSYLPYFPELHLARYLLEAHNDDATVWCFLTMGAQPLLAAYRALIERLDIDGILLVDGGVDSLMRGDEAQMGTVLEDACSLAAVSALDHLKLRRLACVGMGAEQDVTHAHVFENIAALAKVGGFLGSCSFTNRMESCRAYEEAVTFAHAQRNQDPSVINASIVSAQQGEYGNFHLTEKTKGSRLWISPLMPICWFFDVMAVADRNLLLPTLRRSQNFREAARAITDCRSMIPLRTATRIPLA